MILILDGYNVIHRAGIMLSEPLEKQREELIQLAANHSQKKKGQVNAENECSVSNQ